MSAQIEVHTDERVLMPDQEGVAYNVYMDSEKVQCVITGTALKTQFKEPDKPIMEIFADNQGIIAAMTAFLLSTKPERIDGSVIINPEDLKDYPRR